MKGGKIMGMSRPVAIGVLISSIILVWYLRKRAASSASGSGSGAAVAPTLDTSGGGSASTPTANGVGTPTVGTDALLAQESQLFGTLTDVVGLQAQANAQLAANAGTYINTWNTTSTTNTWNNSAPVTTPTGYSAPSGGAFYPTAGPTAPQGAGASGDFGLTTRSAPSPTTVLPPSSRYN